jgi:hypothetical protein
MGISLFPKEKDFLGMLIKQAKKVQQGTEYLVEFINNPNEENMKKCCKQKKKLMS